MASLVLSGDTSGSITVAAPAVAGSNTQTLAAVTGTLAPVVSGTSQTAPFTDNTRAEFTGIPSWAKRITVMFSGVSTNGTSVVQVQIGSGSFTTSGYVSTATAYGAGTSFATSSLTSGFGVDKPSPVAGSTRNGVVVLTNVASNTWVSSGVVSDTASASGAIMQGSSGNITLSGALDRVRVTTVNGTDTFDTGSVINILFE